MKDGFYVTMLIARNRDASGASAQIMAKPELHPKKIFLSIGGILRAWCITSFKQTRPSTRFSIASS